MEESQRLIKDVIRDVFGSSDSEDDERPGGDGEAPCPPTTTQYRIPPRWENVAEIEGLWLCRDFLSAHQQSALLSSIEKEGWLSDASVNQAMRFGDLPMWAVELSTSIHSSISSSRNAESSSSASCCSKPTQLLEREPFFDQLIVNVYQPGEGICAHVDLLRFEDGIAVVSLESSCVMHFSRAEEEACKSKSLTSTSGSGDSMKKIPVLLCPGSLLVMWGDARYSWKHEIVRKQPGFQFWEGQEIDQRRRTSLTLRKLCSS